MSTQRAQDMDNVAKRNIKDLTLAELSDWFSERGHKPFRARQVFQWLYQRRVDSFEAMSDISKNLREEVSAHFHGGELIPEAVHHSQDGSRKLVFGLADGKQLETVLMPNNTHYTVCVSTQVGCAMGCTFCMTARMGLVRNLSAGEILQQVVQAARAAEPDKIIRNVVFMGMGEPFHNYDNVMKALDILNEDHGFGISWRRITVSTSGLVPAIRKFAKAHNKANLAVSLNGATDAMRASLMPINRRWPLAELLEACKLLPAVNRYRITFEYILIKGITDDLSSARELVRLLHPLKCKVNLIPCNTGPDSAHQAPGLDHCRAFQEVLLARGLLATLRISKGQDIQAACGQLIRATEKPAPQAAAG